MRVSRNAILSTTAIAREIQTKATSGALRRAISSLLQLGLLSYTIPEKPNSRMQKYAITPMGEEFLEFEEEAPF
ncbi:Fic family protein [Niabella terrae]